MAGQAAMCPNCGKIMSTNVTNTNPHIRKCSSCGKNVQWWLDKKTNTVQCGLR